MTSQCASAVSTYVVSFNGVVSKRYTGLLLAARAARPPTHPPTGLFMFSPPGRFWIRTATGLAAFFFFLLARTLSLSCLSAQLWIFLTRFPCYTALLPTGLRSTRGPGKVFLPDLSTFGCRRGSRGRAASRECCCIFFLFFSHANWRS